MHLSEVMKTRPTGTDTGGVLFVWENYVEICSYEPNSLECMLFIVLYLFIIYYLFNIHFDLVSLKQIGFVRVMLALEDRGEVELPGSKDHLYDHTKQEGFAAALELDLWLRAEQVSFYLFLSFVANAVNRKNTGRN